MFLEEQRWYDPVEDPVVEVRRVDTLVDDWPTLLWLLVSVRPRAGGEPVWYQVPLGARPERPAQLAAPAVLGRIDTPRGEAHLFDALADDELALAFVRHVAPDVHATSLRRTTAESRTTTLVLDEQLTLEVFRTVRPGPSLDIEVTEALGKVGFVQVPVPITVWRRNQTDLAVLRRFERVRGTGMELATSSLREMFQLRRPPRDCKADFAADATQLGAAIARLHVALGEAFGVISLDGDRLADSMTARLGRVAADRLDETLIASIYDQLRGASDLGSAIRIHGDLGLERTLRLQRDWMMAGFDGEPGRSLDERRQRSSPLRDVAGMTRSLQQAAATALRQLEQADRELRVLADAWMVRNVNAFLSGYADVDEAHRLLPQARISRDALLSVFELDNAVYELVHRPELEDLPVQAIERLLDGDDDHLDDAPLVDRGLLVDDRD